MPLPWEAKGNGESGKPAWVLMLDEQADGLGQAWHRLRRGRHQEKRDEETDAVAVGAVTMGGVVLPTPPLIFPPLPPTDAPKVRERRFPPQPPASRQSEAARTQDAAPLTGDEGLLASGQRSASGEPSTSQPDCEPISGPIVAVEITKGRRRVYRDGDDGGGTFVFHDDAVHRNTRLKDVFNSYLLPNGFPHSVAPEYSDYMFWRGVQYFFGGAISVFTTRSLLGALGVSSRGANEAAAAINWVLKDGAGRLGRFLFARWGRQLDCELKQFRLMGDFLMEAGAALELSTIAMPAAFLPLACTANLAKNLASVAASATRAPIYRTFALQNNMADVTAKGESVANLADIVGTVFGIVLARRGAMVPCFVGLSSGYLYASWREVDSVVLPYLNPPRLAYAVHHYLSSGQVPDVQETNQNEPLLPWDKKLGQGDYVLGARVEDACSGPAQLTTALKQFSGSPYALTYRPDKKKVMVLLMESATERDAALAAFHAHYVLHQTAAARAAGDFAQVEKVIAGSVNHASRRYEKFERKAKARGWKINSTMVNAKDHRLSFLDPKKL